MKWEDILKVLPVPVISILMTGPFAISRSRFGDATTLLAILFLVLCFSLYIAYWSAMAYFREAKQQSLKIQTILDALNSLRKTVENSVGMSWVMTSDQLIDIEREKTAKCKEIWIITPDLASDTGDSPWIPAIRQNVEDGIVYKYICVDRVGISSAARGLKDTFQSHDDKCLIAAVAADVYERFPHRHIVVYDPMNQGGEMDCYAELDAKEPDFWIQLSVDRRNEIIDRAHSIITKGAKPLSAF